MAIAGFHVRGGKGFDKLINNLQGLEEELVEVMREASLIAYRVAYGLCPVDTGWMRGQIKVEYDNYLTFSLQCDCEYMSFNEFGWRGINNRLGTPEHPKLVWSGYNPFMRAGIHHAKKYIDAEVKKLLRKQKRR